MNKKINGVSLLEAMLALAIATTIVLFGLKQYAQYKRDRDAFALKYSVDTLFQAMRSYYYANCANSPPGATNNPTLVPSSNPSNPFPITIKTELKGYIEPGWRAANPLIDSSFGDAGYALQFNNKAITHMRNENFCYYFPSMGKTPNCDKLTNPNAIIYLWIAQVVVQVRDTQMTLALKGLTGADCALASYSPGSIVDCSAGAVSGTPGYLVWQRLPSFASPEMSSGLGGAMPTVKGFNLQYTNDSLAESVSVTYAGSQYYLCGG